MNTTKVELFFQDSEPFRLGRIIAAARLLNNRGVSERTLDCYALVFVMRGGAWFRDDSGYCATLKAGHAFLLFPGLTHGYGPEPGKTWDELYILFDGPVFRLWQQTGLLNPERPLYELHPTELWAERIAGVWTEGGAALEHAVRLQQLLVAMHRGREISERNEVAVQWQEQAMTLLSAHAAEQDAVFHVARKLGLSYQVFRKTFRRLAGMSPGQYCMQCVMNIAARRLMTERSPIKQIAHDLGFCDQYYFSRRFRKIFGAPPGAYRRRMFADQPP